MYALIGVTEGVNSSARLRFPFAVFGTRVWAFSEPYKNQKNTRPISPVLTTTCFHSCHDFQEHCTLPHPSSPLPTPHHTSPRTDKI